MEVWGQMTVLNRVFWVSPIEKLASVLRLERGEEIIHEYFWGESGPGRGSSQCKGPEAGMCLICSKNSPEACVPRAESQEGEQLAWTGSLGGSRSPWDLVSRCKYSSFYSGGVTNLI